MKYNPHHDDHQQPGDLLEALRNNPQWRDAVRAQILSEDLLQLPAKFDALLIYRTPVGIRFYRLYCRSSGGLTSLAKLQKEILWVIGVRHSPGYEQSDDMSRGEALCQDRLHRLEMAPGGQKVVNDCNCMGSRFN